MEEEQRARGREEKVEKREREKVSGRKKKKDWIGLGERIDLTTGGGGKAEIWTIGLLQERRVPE